ncbi:hypothetical protein V6N13_002970 [Hibiscus sabdariffa]
MAGRYNELFHIVSSRHTLFVRSSDDPNMPHAHPYRLFFRLLRNSIRWSSHGDLDGGPPFMKSGTLSTAALEVTSRIRIKNDATLPTLSLRLSFYFLVSPSSFFSRQRSSPFFLHPLIRPPQNSL